MSEEPVPPRPDPALRRLDRFVGTWTMEGNLVGSDEKNVRGETTFRWLPGREDGSFSGGWRPKPGADETVNPPYDIGGHRVE
jgi:hypothetical protein